MNFYIQARHTSSGLVKTPNHSETYKLQYSDTLLAGRLKYEPPFLSIHDTWCILILVVLYFLWLYIFGWRETYTVLRNLIFMSASKFFFLLIKCFSMFVLMEIRHRERGIFSLLFALNIFVMNMKCVWLP